MSLGAASQLLIEADDPPDYFLQSPADGGAHWGQPFPVRRSFPALVSRIPSGTGCPFDQIFTNTFPEQWITAA